MPALRTSALVFVLAALSVSSAAGAQTPTTPAATTKLIPTEQADAPQVDISASDNTFGYTLTVPAQTEPIASDIKAGQLTSPDHPGLVTALSVTMEAPTKTSSGWSVPIRLTGSIPFGTSTISLYYQSKKVETVKILKSGLSVETPPAAQQQSDPLLLIVRNPSGAQYTSVRARLRFRDKDVCTFSVERFPHQDIGTANQKTARKTPEQASMPSQTATADTKPIDSCNEVAGWTEFQIPRYSGVSLRAFPLPEEWFVAPDGYSNAVPQKGTLTLRFSGDAANPQSLQEQVLPVELSFQPGTVDRSLGYVRVFAWLLLGALASLAFRVAIPNYRRSRSIGDQLNEITKTTRGISDEVDSMLRVQLIVENQSLGALSKTVLFISPGYSEIAQRVETAIATLRRRIDYVRRLDAAVSRRNLLIADDLAHPTRITAINRSLHTASEELKSDQFREQDWVFIQQALEAADKSLANPTEDDKRNAETILVQRWQYIAKQYGFDPDKGWTMVPDFLAPMAPCFPSAQALCPRDPNPPNGQPPVPIKESDTWQWIKAVGTARADLQITALELIDEFRFLAPAQLNERWATAMNSLILWLTTPAFENLNNARLLLRELIQGISPEDIVAALQNREAHIELDPQVVGPGERGHLAVRFWQRNWNSAAARQEIVCEWRFKAFPGKRQSGTPQVEPKLSDSLTYPDSNPSRDVDEADTLYYREKGWEIHHYFKKARGRSPLEVLFYFKGKLVMDAKSPTQPLVYPWVFDLQGTTKSKAFWDQAKRIAFESLELFAALLVPLCALAVSTADKGSSSQWWQLLGLGFGSDTIRNVLSATSDSKASRQTQ